MYWESISAVMLALSGVFLTTIYIKYSGKSTTSGQCSIFAWLFHLLQNKPLDVASCWIWADLKSGPKIVYSLQSGSWGRMVASHSAVSQILGNNKNFPKKLAQDSLLGALFGSNLFLSNDDTWRRYRQVLAPPFRKLPDMELLHATMKEVFSYIEAKPNGTPVDAFRLMQHISLDFFAKALLDMDTKTVRDGNLSFLDVFNTLVFEAFNPLQVAFPWANFFRSPFRSPSVSHLASLNELAEKIIESKADVFSEGFGSIAQEKDEKCDVFSLMFKAAHDTEIRFTRTEMRDNLILMFLPTITTASTLSHVLHHLARDQSIQQKIRTEVKAHSIGSQIPTADQLNQMTLLSAVIKETMRLSPAFAQLPTRVATEMCQLDGVEIPPGTDIVIDLFAMQRNPEYYKDPLKFDPERFMLGNDQLPEFSFGGGARACVGMRIALLELKIVIVMLVSRYTIVYPRGFTPRLDPTLAACQILIPLDVNLVLTPITIKRI